MNNLEYLNKIVTIKIDRSMGSKHPKHGFIYPVNYGYVPNTVSGDGEELDSYVLGIYEPLETFTGRCIAIIHRTNDNDDKLVVVPENKTFTNEEIKVLTDFQEQYFESMILRPKDYINWNKNIPELSVTNLEDSLKFYKMAGFKVEYDFNGRSMKAQMKQANKFQAKQVLIFGEDEVARGNVTVRNMATSEQQEIAINDITKFFNTL